MKTNGEEATRTPTMLISISMDVCGSTEAKTFLKNRARPGKQLTKWYEDFYRDFLLVEWDFYNALFRTVPGRVSLNWRRGFVVKGIGDEIWLLYDIPKEDLWKLGSLVAHLLHSALNVADRRIGRTWAWDGRAGPSAVRGLPLKFYVDILEDRFEVSKPRLDFMLERLPQILGPESTWTDADFVQLGNRLHAGILEGPRKRLRTTFRTDYIGWEVDRFFRASGFALPGVVTVGRNLFERVVDVSMEPNEGLAGTRLYKAVIECPVVQGVSKRFDHDFRYVRRHLCASELKGVGSDYAVYRVLREIELLGLHHPDPHDPIMRGTLEVFTPAMKRAVRPQRGQRTGSRRLRNEAHCSMSARRRSNRSVRR